MKHILSMLAVVGMMVSTVMPAYAAKTQQPLRNAGGEVQNPGYVRTLIQEHVQTVAEDTFDERKAATLESIYAAQNAIDSAQSVLGLSQEVVFSSETLVLTETYLLEAEAEINEYEATVAATTTSEELAVAKVTFAQNAVANEAVQEGVVVLQALYTDFEESGYTYQDLIVLMNAEVAALDARISLIYDAAAVYDQLRYDTDELYTLLATADTEVDEAYAAVAVAEQAFMAAEDAAVAAQENPTGDNLLLLAQATADVVESLELANSAMNELTVAVETAENEALSLLPTRN